MDFLRGKHRLGLLLLLLAMLALGTLAAVWSVAGTGAYLTAEGDWQYLAGDYRIGTINYRIEINDQLLLEQDPTTAQSVDYALAVPILGGVRMFDSSANMTDLLRTREFNEGATLMRVRVINHSDNMVSVTADFTLHHPSGGGGAPIRVLPLPTGLTLENAASFNYRQYVLDTLNPAAGADEAASLANLDTAYLAHMTQNDLKETTMSLDVGLLDGATDAAKDYKDVFLLVWSEYGDGAYNVEGQNPVKTTRQQRMTAAFSVGQLD